MRSEPTPAHPPSCRPQGGAAYSASPQRNRRYKMSCPDKIALRSYVTPEEYKIIKENAGRAGMSVSSYIKTICLGHEVKSLEDKSAILELAKVSADLGRLGGLFKLALAEKVIDQLRGNSLLDDIYRARKLLEDKVRKL